MKVSDRIRLALKTLKGGWAVLSAAGVAISVFCLCFAGAVYTTVQAEKAQPYEMMVMAQRAGALTDAAAAEITQIEDVTAATPVLQTPVRVTAGVYSADLTLTATLGTYIDEELADGVIFPEDSVMPYIVLNQAACKLFSDGATPAADEAPDIDWLGESFSVMLGEESNAVTAKVCGILRGGGDADETTEPAAYISLASAKKLLQTNGQGADYAAIKARVTSIGQAQSVSRQISVMGLAVSDSAGELQAGWDMMQKEMGYLTVTGLFCLVCAAVLLSVWRKVSLLEHKKAWGMLIKLGLTQKSIRGIFIVQAVIIALAGIAGGIIVSLALPSFLPPEAADNSVFALTVPPVSAAAAGFISMGAGLAPLLKRKTFHA